METCEIIQHVCASGVSFSTQRTKAGDFRIFKSYFFCFVNALILLKCTKYYSGMQSYTGGYNYAFTSEEKDSSPARLLSSLQVLSRHHLSAKSLSQFMCVFINQWDI